MIRSLFNSIPLGVRYVLFSAVGFSLMSSLVKLVSVHGIPVMEIIAARCLVSVVISYVDVKRKGISIWGNNKKWLVARGLIGTVSLMCVYYALSTLPLAEATILQYTHPIFTSLLALLFLGEHIRSATAICIALCIIGLSFMVAPDLLSQDHSYLPLKSVFIALLGASGSSIAYVIVRKISNSEDSSVIIFYFPIIALPVSVMLLVISGDFVLPNFQVLIQLLLIGVMTQIGQIGLTKAMQTLDAGVASAYSYIQVVFSVALGWLLFKEIPILTTWIGGSLIMAGALINLLGGRKKPSA
ncbi:DMT family transporter [Reinekea thalattae]|uniref:DMT family transporter n=1 Tax=Reinekea thalattae TaxID=2593301 RepID=A0A5C8Z453_9GAMM|nr:DMT family transporter [Reinekea thalattae]TXR52084.1 DMT family transporter [Reinekea thalattae]